MPLIEYKPGEPLPLRRRAEPLSRDTVEEYVAARRLVEKSEPKLSIVVVAYNESASDIARHLDSWSAQTDSRFELVFVDNGLGAEARDLLKNHEATYIKATNNLGCSLGRNVGAAYCRAPVIAFSDADGYVDTTFVGSVVAAACDEWTAIRGRVIPITSDFFPLHYDLGDDACSALMNTEGNSAWKRELFLKSGGFEPSLAGGEGHVLQHRLIQYYGCSPSSFLYQPELVLHHDYHRDQSKWDYKVRQNAIARHELHRFYPFMSETLRYYRSTRPKGGKLSWRQRIAINKIKSNIAQEYERLQQEQRRRFIASGASPRMLILSPQPKLVAGQSLVDYETRESAAREPKAIAQELESSPTVQYVMLLSSRVKSLEPTILEQVRNAFEADESAAVVTCWYRRRKVMRPADHSELDWSSLPPLVAFRVPVSEEKAQMRVIPDVCATLGWR